MFFCLCLIRDLVLFVDKVSSSGFIILPAAEFTAAAHALLSQLYFLSLSIGLVEFLFFAVGITRWCFVSNDYCR